MKIVAVNDKSIRFDNGKSITYDHDQDCCEFNYADFNQLDSIAKAYDFHEPLVFEKVDGYGFRFGNNGAMFFVPCYSEQNGYYSSDLDIYYDNKLVLAIECEWVDC